MYERDEDWSDVFARPTEAELLSPEERANTIAGRYEIIERIGEGGMGQVVRVRHRRLGKAFALKLTQAELSSRPDVRQMFHREARLASALSHPNIVSIVDFGEDPDWGLFIVMEYLEGEPLTRRIESAKRLPIALVCDVAGQLAGALDHSHDHGVVHGDLKSDNVLCVTDGQENERWNVKLLDFGTAHAVAMPLPEAGITGTPEYLAPERIGGAPPNPSNDIYALGVIIYEMLAGRVPFSGQPTEILQRHLTEQPVPVGALRGEVLDDSLTRIVDRALEKDPARRYQTIAELQADLGSYMSELGMRGRALAERLAKQGHDRTEATAAAFEAMPVPAAGLSASGIIVVANPSFARLLHLESVDQVEGTNILQTPLGRLHPELREDLREVAMDGRRVRRRLTVPRAGGGQRVIQLIMTPTIGSCGHCMLVLHSIATS